jgi:hypothetical protein
MAGYFVIWDALVKFCDLPFGQQLVATVVGVFLGMWGSLVVERRSSVRAEQSQDRRAAEEARKSKERVVSLVREGVERNMNTLANLEAAFQQGGFLPMYVDLSHFDATAQMRREIFPLDTTQLVEGVVQWLRIISSLIEMRDRAVLEGWTWHLAPLEQNIRGAVNRLQKVVPVLLRELEYQVGK